MDYSLESDTNMLAVLTDFAQVGGLLHNLVLLEHSLVAGKGNRHPETMMSTENVSLGWKNAVEPDYRQAQSQLQRCDGT
jgi:hypothetical protein